MAGMNVKAVIDGILSLATQEMRESSPGSIGRYASGIRQNPIFEPHVNYNIGPNETVIRGKANTIIVQGYDRPGSLDSGTGAMVCSHRGCIDIIAGLSGVQAREANSKGEDVATNKSTELDSSRIYITQKAKDIDSPEYFNLAKGSVGSPTFTSAIAIKSDSVRIIGRQGIKLVTSTDVYQGSVGMNVDGVIQGIDLIAGNDDSDLQPMVKGDDLVKVLDEITDLIADLNASVTYNFELVIMLALSFVDPTGVAARKLNQLISRLPMAALDLYTNNLNYVFHKANYGGGGEDGIKNPFPPWNFRSKYNHVN
jgi:hypothetical protein